MIILHLLKKVKIVRCLMAFYFEKLKGLNVYINFNVILVFSACFTLQVNAIET